MKLTYALLRKQRTHNLRYVVRTLLMKLAPEFQKHKKVSGLFEQIRNCCSIFMPHYYYIYSVLYGILGTVKAAPHECVFRTGQP